MALMAGCAAPVQVRPMATGTPQGAFELRGASLVELQKEADRLCPRGADVQRQSVRYERPENRDGLIRRWAQPAIDWMIPPDSEAQMMVICKA
ncbi:MAG: hypothetical protein HY021_09230 [Burkholderiales bacterium]|nr:hypothetical protein [Burkholderiales bacterium]